MCHGDRCATGTGSLARFLPRGQVPWHISCHGDGPQVYPFKSVDELETEIFAESHG